MHVQTRASPQNYYSSSFRRIYLAKPFLRPLPVVSYYLLENPCVCLLGWLLEREVLTSKAVVRQSAIRYSFAV